LIDAIRTYCRPAIRCAELAQQLAALMPRIDRKAARDAVHRDFEVFRLIASAKSVTRSAKSSIEREDRQHLSHADTREGGHVLERRADAIRDPAGLVS